MPSFNDLKNALVDCLHIIEQANTATGVCMCGDDIESHGYHSGHSPVDSGIYTANQTVSRAYALLDAPCVRQSLMFKQ